MPFFGRAGAITLLILAAGGSGFAGRKLGAEAAKTVLKSAHEVHSLTSAEASRAYPVHILATVTYYDPFIDQRHAAVFVRDASGSIFVRAPLDRQSGLHAGDVVRVDGVSGAGDYAPIVEHAQVTVVGHAGIPAGAIRATIPKLFSGALDGQWVEVEGVVHSVHASDHNVTLEIATIEGAISATTLREDGADYEGLVDALIRLRGNAGPVFNGKRQLVGTHLFFPSLETVDVLRAAPPDAYRLPLQSVSQLLQFSPGAELPHRVRVQGSVTLQWPGRMLCIQQHSDGMCVAAGPGDIAPEGALADVIGFPAINQFEATLEDASFRVVPGNSPVVEARPIGVDQAVSENHDGELVQVQGHLLGQDHATGDLTLILSAGKFLVLVILPRSVDSPEALTWRDGSLLAVTGVCRIQVNSNSTNRGEGAVRPESVQILLRSPGDIRVMATPSWWNTRHTLTVLALVGILAFGSFIWIFILRQRVEAQTEALRRSEERLRHMSEHDALTGLPNRILLHDRLNMALKRLDRFDGVLGLLMVDLDKFKEVNDSLGHQAGDEVLCLVTRRISGLVRQTDTMARLGGDEFIILLQDLHETLEAERIAGNIVAAVARPIDVAGRQVMISASVGVYACRKGGGDVERLLQSVDHAMYSAKARGRNCYHVHDSDLDSPNSAGQALPV